jgi:hypothetical protein
VGTELSFDSTSEWVFSTWKKAEEFIARCRCDPYAWYSMQLFPIDGDPLDVGSEYGDTLRFYSHTGKQLKDKPIKRAMKAYLREAARKNSRVCPLMGYREVFGLPDVPSPRQQESHPQD